MSLADAASRADELAASGNEKELAQLRLEWADEVEAAARDADYRARATAYRAIGQFRFRQKQELLARGLEDESPACRGSALISLELLSRDHPGVLNSQRPLLHRMVASEQENLAVRRLAAMCLRNGSPQQDTITLLKGLSDDDELDGELRRSAGKVAEALRKRAPKR
jgi:HEAT repeat protein